MSTTDILWLTMFLVSLIVGTAAVLVTAATAPPPRRALP